MLSKWCDGLNEIAETKVLFEKQYNSIMISTSSKTKHKTSLLPFKEMMYFNVWKTHV